MRQVLSLNLAAAGWLLTLCMKFKPYKRQHKLLPDENAFGSVWGDRLEFVQKVTTKLFLTKYDLKEVENRKDREKREHLIRQTDNQMEILLLKSHCWGFELKL